MANSLRLLELDGKVRELIAEGQLSQSHGKALVGMAATTQVDLATAAIGASWSAHELERQIQWRRQQEENRKSSAAEERRKAKQRDEQLTARVEKARVPKDARVVVAHQYGGQDALVGHTAEQLRRAGFTAVETGTRNVESRSAALGCDCIAWIVRVSNWSLPTAVRACVNPAHVRAKQRAADAKRSNQNATQRAVKAHLTKVLPRIFRTSKVPDLAMRLMLWDALGYAVADFAEKRGGKRTKPWETIASLNDEQLTEALGKALASAVGDQFGYHLPWDELAAELGISGESASSLMVEIADDDSDAPIVAELSATA